MSGAMPRAVGVRTRYQAVPAGVRSWVDDVLGSPVVETLEQVGGMSPGCATRVLTASGTRAFVKAVGPELNPMTPDLFRHEARVLSHLGAHPLWAELLATYDEPDGWVALVLEDVPARHVDTNDAAETAAALGATELLVAELAGRAVGLDLDTSMEALTRWMEVWSALPVLPDDVLPRWVVDRSAQLEELHERLLPAAVGDCVVHGDLRNDNILLRDDGRVVFVDWGMSRRGPSWFDPLLMRLEWVEQPVFDELVVGSPELRELGDDLVTGFLAGVGAWLAYRSHVAEDLGLPTLNEFRKRESARLLEGVRRRLGVPAGTA